jgi:hypothetical protein
MEDRRELSPKIKNKTIQSSNPTSGYLFKQLKSGPNPQKSF